MPLILTTAWHTGFDAFLPNVRRSAESSLDSFSLKALFSD